MRNKRVTASLCAGLLLVAAAGCGKSDEYLEVPEVVADNQSDNSVEDVGSEQGNNEEVPKVVADNQFDNPVEDVGSEQNNTEDLISELDGDIESIGDNSVVINQILHPSENVAVSYEGEEEKVLVTVYFSDETEFEVWTIKNGGVNGDADTEKRQGTFSDLKQDTTIRMTGSYSGNDFYAKQVIILCYI